MNPETLEALKAAYAAMLRDTSGWRIRNQPFYCSMRKIIADATQLPEESVQQILEEYTALVVRF